MSLALAERPKHGFVRKDVDAFGRQPAPSVEKLYLKAGARHRFSIELTVYSLDINLDSLHTEMLNAPLPRSAPGSGYSPKVYYYGTAFVASLGLVFLLSLGGVIFGMAELGAASIALLAVAAIAALLWMDTAQRERHPVDR